MLSCTYEVSLLVPSPTSSSSSFAIVEVDKNMEIDTAVLSFTHCSLQAHRSCFRSEHDDACSKILQCLRIALGRFDAVLHQMWPAVPDGRCTAAARKCSSTAESRRGWRNKAVGSGTCSHPAPVRHKQGAHSHPGAVWRGRRCGPSQVRSRVLLLEVRRCRCVG